VIKTIRGKITLGFIVTTLITLICVNLIIWKVFEENLKKYIKQDMDKAKSISVSDLKKQYDFGAGDFSNGNNQLWKVLSNINNQYGMYISFDYDEDRNIEFLGTLIDDIERKNRITYVDWIYPLLEEASNKDYRVFFLGSKPGVAARAKDILKTKIDKLQLETAHGFFEVTKGCDKNQKVLQRINDYKPHILLVGMGMPRQEFWILENFDQIEANIILTAGACMDYIAEEIATPPRWMGQIGLEWLFRLFKEPKRLWKRYLIEPWFIARLFFIELFQQNLGIKK